jgi:hypothetical protein
MAEYFAPGVYVEEYDSGAVPMQGVSTNTAGFIGLAERGPVSGPQLVTSIADYRRIFGGYLSAGKYGNGRFLPYAVEQFFLNGGGRAYVERVVPGNATASSVVAGSLKISAENPGVWGDMIRVTVTPASKARSQVMAQKGAELTLKNADGFVAGDIVELFDGKAKKLAGVRQVVDNVVTLDVAVDNFSVADPKIGSEKYIRTLEFNLGIACGEDYEEYNDLSLNPELPNFVGARLRKSDLVRAEIVSAAKAAAPAAKDGKSEAVVADAGLVAPFAQLGGAGKEEISLQLSGGSDGSVANVTPDVYIGIDNGPNARTGIQALLEVPEVAIVAVPGVAVPEVQSALVSYCENQKSCFAVLDMPSDLRKTNDLLKYRNLFDTTYAAMYHPWVKAYDGLSKRTEAFPPSGAIVGIYARTDSERGIQKAPANEIVRGAMDLTVNYGQGEQEVLNPVGVNLIRAFTGRGIRVWGARTLSSNGLWKYINVRRLFIYVEQSIKVNTNWVVFEPNGTALWERVTATISNFLSTLWRNGALAGDSTGEAFYVECGKSTMSQDDIDNGRLICNIGIAPLKPAEFVIFRITQKTSAG